MEKNGTRLQVAGATVFGIIMIIGYATGHMSIIGSLNDSPTPPALYLGGALAFALGAIGSFMRRWNWVGLALVAGCIIHLVLAVG